MLMSNTYIPTFDGGQITKKFWVSSRWLNVQGFTGKEQNGSMIIFHNWHSQNIDLKILFDMFWQELSKYSFKDNRQWYIILSFRSEIPFLIIEEWYTLDAKTMFQNLS